MSSAENFSEWIAAPAPLEDVNSYSKAVFSDDGSIAEKGYREDGDCCCQTIHPLPSEQLWQITVLKNYDPGFFEALSSLSFSLQKPGLVSTRSDEHCWFAWERPYEIGVHCACCKCVAQVEPFASFPR